MRYAGGYAHNRRAEYLQGRPVYTGTHRGPRYRHVLERIDADK